MTDTPTTDSPRSVCVVLVDRANYGRLKPVMAAIHEHPALRLQVLAAGTMVLERFDRPVNVVRSHGFPIDGEVFVELEGSNPTTMAKSVGLAISEFTSQFHRLAPDMAVIIGDRYEALGAAIAAAYMNIPIVHLQGGEVSGSIDESARHAITKFAQFHVPATDLAARRVLKMGERPDTVLTVGCPSSDLAREQREQNKPLPAAVLNSQGSGATIDPGKPFLLVVFHPVTTEYSTETGQVSALLEALAQIAMPTVLLWSNIDAGADHINKRIRKFRAELPGAKDWLRVLINVPPDDYLHVLGSAACCVGNSSSFVRDAGFFGTPVVLIGSRQDGREHGEHLHRVNVETAAIVAAVNEQLTHGRYAPCTIYGDGHVSSRVAAALATLQPHVQKRFFDHD